jgi:hypothetical protein
MAPRPGAIPDDAALAKVIREGLPDSAMPSFAWMSEEEIRAVLQHVRKFFERRPKH